MKLGWQPKKWIEKKAKRGMRGHPVGTIAFYGPDNRRATKAAVCIITTPNSEPFEIRRWLCETGDLRTDEAVSLEIATFLRQPEVQSVVAAKGIFGCPHEEGIDYPLGESCPNCPYWAGRVRWAGPLDLI